MLKLNNISKRYNKEQALESFSYQLDAGSTTVVIGPSGCGKSTLLRLITGLLEADSGDIHFDDTELCASTLPELRLRMGYVIQEGGLFPHLSARANITIMPRYLRWQAERIEARMQELASMVQLPKSLLERYPDELSGGQRQRVSLMRALMLDPELILLDEPLAALDPMIRFDLQHELKAIFEELGKMVLMVTHDLGEAAFFGDELVLLKQGRLEQQGRMSDLLERPQSEFVERFVRAQGHKVGALGGNSR